MGSRFETSLKPPKTKWVGGYMFRRFGWPNFGSDDYKELCSWSLFGAARDARKFKA